MKIAFASGKGGTGKTTIAANLAYLLSLSDKKVQYLDCDVEEPNGHIFLKPEISEGYPVEVMVPVIDQKRCTSCGECVRACQFNALICLPGNTMLFPELCHSCRLCVRVCPAGAISEGRREVGHIERGGTEIGIDFVHGILNIGEPMATPVIKDVKGNYREGYIKVIDAPPGTSCPVVKAIEDADVVVMVTEPTPFGLHDLKIAVSVAKELGKPVGVVVNRERGGFAPLLDYLLKNRLPVLMSLLEDMEIAKEYSKGNLILKGLSGYRERFMELEVGIERLAGIKEQVMA